MNTGFWDDNFNNKLSKWKYDCNDKAALKSPCVNKKRLKNSILSNLV